jgi:16S rRNA (guanine527-N7)-methyltransferase
MELNEQIFKSELVSVFKMNGLGSLINSEKSDKFYLLTKRMLEENEKYNLTAIVEPEKIILNHYADCATLAAKIPHGSSLIDIGCGAGFPTLPLAIVRDDLKILAIDSTAKRINYVSETAKLIGLSGVTAQAMRAEDGARVPELRERFDFATARAVAEMRILTELCLPYVKCGGKMIAMKGRNAEFELAGAKRAIAILGGGEVKVESVSLTNGRDEPLTHPLIIVKKKSKTPDAYPRAYAQISKKPL